MHCYKWKKTASNCQQLLRIKQTQSIQIAVYIVFLLL